MTTKRRQSYTCLSCSTAYTIEVDDPKPLRCPYCYSHRREEIPTAMTLAGYYASQHRHLKQQQGRFPLKTAEEDEYEMDEDFGDEDNDYDENDPNESLGSRA